MATVVLTAPGGTPNGHKVNTPNGVVSVSGGTVTVDARAVRDLMKVGYTSVLMPDMVDLSPTKNIAMNVPAGSNIGFINTSGGPTYPVVAGVVTVPRNIAPALVEAGFTV